MLRRYIETVRHLRPEQIGGQIWNRLRRALERPERWNPGSVPDLPGWQRGALSAVRAPVPPVDSNRIQAGRFRFAGEEGESGWPPEWSAAGASKLWCYNLHYHDWLWALSHAGELDALLHAVLAWIDSYPLERGALGWDPYPTSLRLQNWIILLFRRHHALLADAGVADRIWASLWRQARRLETRLEYHLLGNHLLENAATLCLLGATFGGEDARRWRAKGCALLQRELPEQMLPDGMHFERSPMYHQRVTWLLGMLAEIEDERIASLAGERLRPALHALDLLRHPDGEIALLNDAGLGIYAGTKAERGAEGAWALGDAGYYGYRSKEGDYVVCDAGPIGPDYLPGHGHADCLSFELSVGGRRVVTDTGVSDYTDSDARREVRSTAAHNTVEVNGEDQARMWGAFRVGARGKPIGVRWEPREEGFVLRAGHTGYRRLAARVTHAREFKLDGAVLEIRDTLEGRGSYRAVARLHFSPACAVERVQGGLIVNWEGGSMRVTIAGAGRIALKESAYYERFGVCETRTSAEYELDVNGRASWTIRLDWS